MHAHMPAGSGTTSSDPAPTDFGLEIRLRATIGQQALVAARGFAPGDVLVPFRAAATFSAPARMTVQVATTTHVELSPWFLAFTNHACVPNAFFDTDQMVVTAMRAIEPGDEVTFFYPSTEWHMAEPFACACGAASCLGLIAGASQLSPANLLGHLLSRHVRELLAARSAAELDPRQPR